MQTISLKDAKRGFHSLVDEAAKGEFVMITRHGKPVAALVSLAAADIARTLMGEKRAGLVAYLRMFPDEHFERNHTSSRTFAL